jgi:hypothetical protein
MATAEEKKAENESTFREANEKLERFAEAIVNEEEQPIPFLCECTDAGCTTVVLMTMPEYEHVRAKGNRGFNVPGHEDPTVERVTERGDGYVITEKFGRAGEVSEELNPRS